MSRFKESKIMEHDERLEHLEHNTEFLKNKIEKKEKEKWKQTNFTVVAIEFNEEKYKQGEAEVNRNLSKGLVIHNDYKTDSGIVIFMCKWKKIPNEDCK